MYLGYMHATQDKNLEKENIGKNRIIVQKRRFSMKKMLTTLTAVALSVAAVSTVEARIGKAAMATPQQVQMTANRMEKTATKPISPTASENVTVRAVNRKVADIQKIEQDLRNLRSWRGDLISGYSEEDREMAEEKVNGFALQLAQANSQIKQLSKDRDAYTKRSLFGWGPMQVTDQENYNSKETRIKELKAEAASLEAAIAQQEVIVGKKYCDAIRAGFVTIVAIAASIKLDQIFNNGKLSEAAIQQISDTYKRVAAYTPESVTKVFGWAKGKAVATGSAVYGAGARAAGAAYEYGAAGVAGARGLAERAGLMTPQPEGALEKYERIEATMPSQR
jgi:hypothetical protein